MTAWEKSVIEKVKVDGKGKTFSPIPDDNFKVQITFPQGLDHKAAWIQQKVSQK